MPDGTCGPSGAQGPGGSCRGSRHQPAGRSQHGASHSVNLQQKTPGTGTLRVRGCEAARPRQTAPTGTQPSASGSCTFVFRHPTREVTHAEQSGCACRAGRKIRENKPKQSKQKPTPPNNPPHVKHPCSTLLLAPAWCRTMTTALRSRASSRLLRTQPRQRGRGNTTAAALATPLEPHQTPGWGHTGHAAGATPPGPHRAPRRGR